MMQTSGISTKTSILTRDYCSAIAYNKLNGENPGIVFIHGFKSNKNSEKALAIENFCANHNKAFIRFDMSGHGESAGNFEDGTISSWTNDVIDVLDSLTSGPQILIGSSMGGWLMLLATLARCNRIAGLFGLAAAPDFTEELIFNSFNEKQKETLLRKNYIMIKNCSEALLVSNKLIKDGRKHLILQKQINITCPIRLIHGQKDNDVPWNTALRLQERLVSDDVEVILIKSSDHHLNKPDDIVLIKEVLDSLIKKSKNLLNL
ncbi:MAG: alpha/beta hydrolase [Rhodospirillaceae bacterium]|jgi:pimeloyl-ACP methyl ester carboxylesterase|nr:alpha/beta hydrolase [Rhodospirillaceae bacterium]